MNLSTTQIADEARCSEERRGEARGNACRWAGFLCFFFLRFIRFVAKSMFGDRNCVRIQKKVGLGWKNFVWQLISVFAFKIFYYAFDTQLAENETTFYMFLLVFGYCSKDWWQFFNFLHKLTGGILVIKYTTLFLFLTCSTAWNPNYSKPISFAESLLLPRWISPPLKSLMKHGAVRRGEARRGACRWVGFLRFFSLIYQICCDVRGYRFLAVGLGGLRWRELEVWLRQRWSHLGCEFATSSITLAVWVCGGFMGLFCRFAVAMFDGVWLFSEFVWFCTGGYEFYAVVSVGLWRLVEDLVVVGFWLISVF